MERCVRVEEIRLREIELQSAVERRPSRVRARFARAAQEVEAVIFGVDARLFFRAVADTEVHTLVRALGDGDPRRHDVGLLLDVHGLHVDELKERHAVQLSLQVLHPAPPVDVTRLERDLPQDDVVADALVALHRGGPEMCDLARFTDEGELGLQSVGAVVFVDSHLRVRIAMVPQLVERHLARRQHLLFVSRLVQLNRRVLLHRVQVRFRNDVEALVVDRGDDDGLAFVDGQRDVDGVLFRAQRDVEAADSRVRIAAIAVERRNAFEIVVELRAVEEAFRAPEELRARLRHERVRQRAFIDALHALELDRVDQNRSRFAARRRRDDDRGERHAREETAEHHARAASKHVPPSR